MRRIVLSGGPGAGKTVVCNAIVARHPERFVLVPEAATQIYARLNTRWDRLDLEGRREAQRKIYHLQVEQEEKVASAHADKELLLDRGTVDGSAYWPEGPEAYWKDLGTSLGEQLKRYDVVVMMESSAVLGVYDGSESNECRFEDAAGAIEGGTALEKLWGGHPRVYRVEAEREIQKKIEAVERLIL